MSEEFNPYRVWLGIPKKYLPANHYRLLGLELFENDPDVIEAAADKQMSFIRTFQTGRHSAESQQILNEISVARICLLNPERKSQYDIILREQESKRAGLSGILPPPPPVPTITLPPPPPVPTGTLPPPPPVSTGTLPPPPPVTTGTLPPPPPVTTGTIPPPPPSHRNEENGSNIEKAGKESRKSSGRQPSNSDSNSTEKPIPNFDFLNQTPSAFSDSRYITAQTSASGSSSTTSQEILLADNLPPVSNEESADSSQREPQKRKTGRKRRTALKIFFVLITITIIMGSIAFIPQKFVPNSLVSIQNSIRNAVKFVLPSRWNVFNEDALQE